MPFPRLTLPYEGHRIGDGVDGLSGRGCYSAIDFKNSGMSSAQVLLQCIPTSFESLEYHDKSLTDAASYVAAHNFCAKLKAKGGYSFVKASVSASQEFKEKASTKHNSHVHMMAVTWTSAMVTPEHHLSDIPLSQDAQDFLVSDGPTEFMREYGTHYVAGLQKGLQYSVILTYESNDAEQVRQILANFGSEVTVGGVASVQAEFAANMKTSKQTSTVTEEINVVARGWPMNYAAATKDHVQICKNFADSTNTVFGGAVAAELIPYESGVRGWRKMVAQYKQSRLMDTPTQPDFLQAAIAVSDAIQALTECQLRVHFLSGKGKIVTTKLRQRMDFASSQLATLDGTQKLAPYQYFLANKAEPASQEHAKDWEAGHLVAEALNMVIAITKELQNLG